MISIRKQEHYLKHFRRITSKDASRPGRLIWGGV
jgi:hypothetical protein